jgi:polar amino acid transport system permease protein
VNSISDFFRDLYESTGWNFSIFYMEWDAKHYFEGVVLAVQIAFWSVLGMLVVGVLVAAMNMSAIRPLRWLGIAFVEFFRNTPTLAQLLFLVFGIGSSLGLTKYGPQGQEPFISALQFVILALSLHYGAYCGEALRSGIEAVSHTTKEAAESLGFNHFHTQRYVIYPLAFRIALPAIGNNVIQVIKASSVAYVVAVPEALYVASEIWSTRSNVPEMMIVVLVTYMTMMWMGSLATRKLESLLAVPGFGR